MSKCPHCKEAANVAPEKAPCAQCVYQAQKRERPVHPWILKNRFSFKKGGKK